MDAFEEPTPDIDRADIYERISLLARSVHGTLTGGVMTPQQVLDEVTEAAVQILDSVDHAGITLVRRAGPGRHPSFLESTASTSSVPQQFDALQQRYAQGPCLDAIWSHQTVRIADVSSEHRWPRLMSAVREQTSVQSMMSIQLFTDGQELGALNIYSDSAGGFGDDIEEQAVNLATHAAIALSSARRGQQFRSALASRDLIGQAKGILMERFDIDAIAAFRMLRTLSQEMNVPVIELATRVAQRENLAAESA
ncbi:GAF and ANTAR domain-containing protein [Rhodococcus erythropolis]|uniref:GAF and ANTAR domain-containing protein n=1 Tax=Rhodococcus erythropolis TaxID=1833 RepID=UPI0027E38122|nr:GAF and ANTAR domain-containing protein [Rhodococcus erythropolis]